METALEIVGKSRSELKQSLDVQFKPFRETAENISAQLKMIKVTDASQIDQIQQASEIREKLSDARIKVTKLHKALKADALTTGQVLDEIKRTVNGLIEPLEEEARESEEFVERQETKRKRDLAKTRLDILLPIMGPDAMHIELGEMSQAMFEAVVLGAKQKKIDDDQAEVDRVKKVEEDRLANEKLKKENDKLKTQNTNLKQAVTLGDIFSVKRGVSSMTDKQKLEHWADHIANLVPPEVGPEYKKTVDATKVLLGKTKDYIIKNIS